MSVIWLSPRLPADRSALAEDLGPGVEISSAPMPPAGTAVAVATVYERPLLEQLAAVPGAGALLLLKPPGTATPLDLPASAGPLTVAEAADVGEAARAVRGVLAGVPALWPEATAVGAAASSGWLLAGPDSPTGELPSAAVPAPRRTSRRHWVASGGIIGAAALAAVVVLATQGGASGTSNAGFRGPGGFAGGGGFGNEGFGNGGFGSGGFGSGTAPGAGSGQGSTGSGSTGTGSTGSGSAGGSTGSTDRAAQRQAFLACLSKNGVDTSSLTQGSGRVRLDPSDPTVASALQACRSLLPERGFRGGAGGAQGDGPGGAPFGGGPGMPGGAGAPGGGTSGSAGTAQSSTGQNT